jgi:RNA polymerase sigma-70 factor (ECF subfamily)
LKRYTQQEIIRGCKKQDPLYQKALVVQYSGLLMSIGQRYTRDSEATKDILQEGLIKILKALPSYEEQGSFEAWMKRIVINTALKTFDKSSFRNELYTIDDLPETAVDPSVYSNLAANELISIINQLPETYKTIFNLHAIEGYSHKEISEMIGIEESTSRSQLTRARGMLKKYLYKQEKIRLRI